MLRWARVWGTRGRALRPQDLLAGRLQSRRPSLRPSSSQAVCPHRLSRRPTLRPRYWPWEAAPRVVAPRPTSRGALGLRGPPAPWPNVLSLGETAGCWGPSCSGYARRTRSSEEAWAQSPGSHRGPGCLWSPGSHWSPGCLRSPGCHWGPGSRQSPGSHQGPGSHRDPGCLWSPGCHQSPGLIGAADSRPVWSCEGRARLDRRIGKAAQQAHGRQAGTEADQLPGVGAVP